MGVGLVRSNCRFPPGVFKQQKVQFTEVTPALPARSGNVAVTIRIAGAEAEVFNGADAATVETVLRFLRSC